MQHSDAVINYNNIYSSCYSQDTIVCSNRVQEHSLIYIKTGRLDLQYNGEEYHYTNDACIFIRRSHEVQLTKRPSADGQQPFQGIFFLLDKKFLATRFKQYSRLDYPLDSSPILELEKHPVLLAFFNTFISYRETGIVPDEEVVKAKEYEALDILLKIKPSLVKSLFDFAKPWKIDLEHFMNENYATDMTLNEFAHYTGRSLSSFKRDFKDVFRENPHQWLKNRKLEEAYRLLKHNNLKPSDIYMDLGFKSLSHFSSSFKEKFGIVPTAI